MIGRDAKRAEAHGGVRRSSEFPRNHEGGRWPRPCVTAKTMQPNIVRKHPRFPVHAPATIEVPLAKGRAVVKGSLSDLSRGGVCVRASVPSLRVAPGSEIVVRFKIEGRSFSLPGHLIWTRSFDPAEASAGVRLDLERASAAARRAFTNWTLELERSRSGPGALPPREQLECRLAALTGSLDQLLGRLDEEGDALDGGALHDIDIAAEHLQNAITALELMRTRRRVRRS